MFPLNVPNVLTVVRILLVPVLVAVLLEATPGVAMRPRCSTWQTSS